MATCLELEGFLRAPGGLLEGLTLPIAAMAERGLLGRPTESGLAKRETPGFCRGVLAAPSALSSLPEMQCCFLHHDPSCP